MCTLLRYRIIYDSSFILFVCAFIFCWGDFCWRDPIANHYVHIYDTHNKIWMDGVKVTFQIRVKKKFATYVCMYYIREGTFFDSNPRFIASNTIINEMETSTVDEIIHSQISNRHFLYLEKKRKACERSCFRDVCSLYHTRKE